jgi:hypothetical protein
MKNEKKTRHFYAIISPYGPRAVYNKYNSATVRIFDSKSERDKFVDRYENAEAVTADYAKKYI